MANTGPFVHDEQPPPYDDTPADANPFQDDIDHTDDGRITVNTSSRLFKTLSRHVPDWEGPIIQEAKQPSNGDDSSVNLEAPRRLSGRLNIVIQLVGSRGDVQPFIALGQALRRDGHRVRLATHDTFHPSVQDAGLEFYPIGGDPSELMAYMVQNPGLIPSMRSLRAGHVQRKRQMVADMLGGFWRSCVEPDPETGAPFVADAIIANPPSFAHVHCAEALGVPLHLMFTMPWTSTRAFPHPLANLKNGSGSSGRTNYVSYMMVECMTWQGLGDVINDWRRSIDLEPVPLTHGPELISALEIPFTYCWSSSLVPRPLDWPDHIDVCGFYFRDPPSYTPPDDLRAFLEVPGPPPVYIGFGSIVLEDAAAMTARLVRAVRAVGVRAIISRGWSGLGGEPFEGQDDVMFLGDCPHEWLFPHVAAVVHHGGAGTTACGLRYGKPTAVVPFFGDQPFWGEMIASAGAGPRPIPHKQLTDENLAAALHFCLTQEAQAAAHALAEKMNREDGVGRAVQSFYDHLPAEGLFCDARSNMAAVWQYRHNGNKLRLSGVAVELLIKHGTIDRRHLKPYVPKEIVIENRRWDPITGTTSSLLGTFVAMGESTTDIVVKPAQLYHKRASAKQSLKAGLSESTSSLNLGSGVTQEEPSASSFGTVHGQHSGDVNLAASMAMASAAGVGGFLHHFAKGMLLDMPLAFAEGARSVPQLYGEAPPNHSPVRDWKTGFMVSGENFAHGISKGCADLVVQPYRGAKKDGVMGGIAGMGKGLLGFSSKVASAAVGVTAYSGLGIYKSIRHVVRDKTRNSIVKARQEEAEWFYKSSIPDLDEQAVLRAFRSLIGVT